MLSIKKGGDKMGKINNLLLAAAERFKERHSSKITLEEAMDYITTYKDLIWCKKYLEENKL